MLFKLSITGIKSRLRDYLILFSGLAVAAAIFYMFQSVATNKAFLENSNTIQMVVFVFQFGTILLGLITLVYISYANSFLMMIRQKTYAMLMMLGARTSKIGKLIFLETLLIGIGTTGIGILIGIGLTTIVNQLLVNQLDIVVSHYSAFSLSAIIWTLGFFLISFVIMAIINARSIAKKPILELLTEQATPKFVKRNPIVLFLETLVGVISLSLGYFMLANLEKYQMMGIFVALVTIVIGSFLLFHGIAIFVLGILKKIAPISMKELNNFTISQLSFRIREYTQILTMVSILFALAMGAITVGLGFRNEIMVFTNKSNAYDLVLNNAQKMNQTEITDLSPTSDVVYSQKKDDTTIYYKEDQLNQNKLLVKEIPEGKIKEYSSADFLNNPSLLSDLKNYQLPSEFDKEIKIVTASEFDAIDLPESTIQFINVSDFKAKLSKIKNLVSQNEENNPELKDEMNQMNTSQKYYVYRLFNSLYSGFQFIGFFLGIAFLTMLASCLMFKILSSANYDKSRYQMLRKIGTRPSLLKSSIRKEIGVLFLLPGILGMVHVLFGLQMFKLFLSNPYKGIWLPFTIFILLYIVYYILTVTIYSRIVLIKED